MCGIFVYCGGRSDAALTASSRKGVLRVLLPSVIDLAVVGGPVLCHGLRAGALGSHLAVDAGKYDLTLCPAEASCGLIQLLDVPLQAGQVYTIYAGPVHPAEDLDADYDTARRAPSQLRHHARLESAS